MQSLTTDAIILAQWPSREHDRWMRFVSPHLGLAEARVISGLKTKSKLAPHLLTYSKSRLTLISGRSQRRIIGAKMEASHNFNDLPVRALWCLILERLAPRQPKDENLYDILSELYRDLENQAALAESALRGIAKLFAYFGYVPWTNPNLEKANFTWVEDNLFAIIERPLPAWEYFKKSAGFFN